METTAHIRAENRPGAAARMGELADKGRETGGAPRGGGGDRGSGRGAGAGHRGGVHRWLNQDGHSVTNGAFKAEGDGQVLGQASGQEGKASMVLAKSGQAKPETEKGRMQGELRILMSISSLRASMACMLDRCKQIGDTEGLCTRRREVAVQVEEQMRRQREAQHLARVREGHILRRGHILMQ